MKRYLLIAFVLVMLVTQVSAFNWTESVPIHSTDRQEARINGLWLLIEPTHSSTHGFITYPFDSGYLRTFYEGHDILYNYHSVYGYAVLNNTWYLPFDSRLFFSGNVQSLRVDSVAYTNVGMNGFFEPDSGQIYQSYHPNGCGVTWVSFTNGGVK